MINTFNNEYNKEKKTLAFRELYHLIVNNILMLDKWYKHSLKINKSATSSDLELELQGAIEYRLKDYFYIIKKIGNDFFIPLMNTIFPRGFDEYHDHLADESLDLIENKLNDVHFIWTFGMETDDTDEEPETSANAIASKGIHRVGKTLQDLLEEEKFQNELQNQAKLLILNYRPVYRVIAYIVQSAPKLLAHNFQHNAKHQPHIGLFLSFLHLMQYLKKDY